MAGRAGAPPARDDPAASVEALAAEVGPLAFSVALNLLGDRASAEDALHDAFLQAWRGLRSFRGEASLRTWFLRIVVNCCSRHRRLWRRWTGWTEWTREGPAAPAEAAPGGVHFDALGDPALRARLEAAVVRLPPRQRTAFVLRYGQDLSIEETAEVMGCATGTVKATLHKAVLKLREELGDLGRGEST